jgi:hypothetical protein
MWIHRSQMAAEPRWQDPVLLVTPSPGPSGSNCPVDGTLISPALCAHRFTPGTPVRALCRWPLLSLILSKAVLLAADD